MLYEGGIREPLIVRGPMVRTAGRVCDVPVSSIDFFPTLLEAAGVATARGHKPDGDSFLQCVREAGTRLPERPLFWYYPLEKPHFLGGRSAAAVRLGDYKLIQFLDDRSAELYNLRTDEGETRDLAGTMKGKAAELRGILEKWRGAVGAR